MNLSERAEDIFGQVKAYVQTNVEIVKLEGVYKLSNVVSNVVTSAAWMLCGLMFLLFVSISGALYLGEVAGRNSVGFIAVGGFYFLVMLIFLVTRKTTKRSVMNLFIKNMLKEDKEWKE